MHRFYRISCISNSIFRGWFQINKFIAFSLTNDFRWSGSLVQFSCSLFAVEFALRQLIEIGFVEIRVQCNANYAPSAEWRTARFANSSKWLRFVRFLDVAVFSSHRCRWTQNAMADRISRNLNWIENTVNVFTDMCINLVPLTHQIHSKSVFIHFVSSFIHSHMITMSMKTFASFANEDKKCWKNNSKMTEAKAKRQWRIFVGKFMLFECSIFCARGRQSRRWFSSMLCHVMMSSQCRLIFLHHSTDFGKLKIISMVAKKTIKPLQEKARRQDKQIEHHNVPQKINLRLDKLTTNVTWKCRTNSK